MIHQIMNHIKKAIKSIPIIRDYRCFFPVYYECSSKWKFLKYRYVRKFKNNVYWPTHQSSEVRGRVIVGKGARVGHRPNCIIQGRGKVFVGDYVEIAPNCVIISANHALLNQDDVVRMETIIGDYCWLASSSIILAGVSLGPRTIVGAGSVVTKSFEEGYCVVAGNPAKIVKKLEKDDFVQKRLQVEYYGYIRQDKFVDYARKNLGHIKFGTNLELFTANKDLIKLFTSDD